MTFKLEPFATAFISITVPIFYNPIHPNAYSLCIQIHYPKDIKVFTSFFSITRLE